MKKLLVVIVTLVLTMALLSVSAFAESTFEVNHESDLDVHLSGIAGCKTIGEYKKNGVNYCIVERNGWTWIVSSYLDVVTGIGATGGEWHPDTLELWFTENNEIFYPANFDQILFNLTNKGGWTIYW